MDFVIDYFVNLDTSRDTLRLELLELKGSLTDASATVKRLEGAISNNFRRPDAKGIQSMLPAYLKDNIAGNAEKVAEFIAFLDSLTTKYVLDVDGNPDHIEDRKALVNRIITLVTHATKGVEVSDTILTSKQLLADMLSAIEGSSDPDDVIYADSISQLIDVLESCKI